MAGIGDWARLARAACDGEGLGDALRVIDPGPLLTPLASRPVRREVKVRVYRRDSFTCRYCGQATIFEPVFAVLGLLYPEQAPFQPNWRTGACHPDVRAFATTLDHYVPRRLGGTDTEDNLVTACPRCNYTKADFEFEGDLLPPAGSSWDGLSGVYPQLVRMATGRLGTIPAFHGAWLRALDSADVSTRQS